MGGEEGRKRVICNEGFRLNHFAGCYLGCGPVSKIFVLVGKLRRAGVSVRARSERPRLP